MVDNENHFKINFVFNMNAEDSSNDNTSNILILDCANSHKGLLAGIGLMILTAASLIVYLLSSSSHDQQSSHGLDTIDTWEFILHVLSLAALALAVVKLWGATHIYKKGVMCLDTWLIMVGQSGVSLYSLFKITSICLSENGNLTNELLRLIQSLAQTLFIVHYWRLRTNKHGRPARQLITFLLLCNAALWSVNTLVRNKIGSDVDLLKFYGPWGWTAISRIAMPLNIFYRFHSTICLFEIWKTMYKPASRLRRPVIPLLDGAQ